MDAKSLIYLVCYSIICDYMAKKQRDVVCGMDVDENSKFKSNYNKQNYYFCSESCKKEFDSKPKKYVH